MDAPDNKWTVTMSDGNKIDPAALKFLGTVTSFNESKKSGMVACTEAQEMWGQEIYAFQDVLATVGATIGDTIRFGVHVNPRGQPQVSLPIFKVGEDGLPMNVPEDTLMQNVEDLIMQDPNCAMRLKQEIENRSHRQNLKRGDKGLGKGMGMMGMMGKGKGKGMGFGDFGPPMKRARMGDMAMGAIGGADMAWGGGGGWGSKGGFGGDKVTLFVGGVPPGVGRRELLHIFRPYAGFVSMRSVEREDHTIVFVTYASFAQAQFVCEALQGYVFDEEVAPDQQSALSIQPAKDQGSKGKGGGKKGAKM